MNLTSFYVFISRVRTFDGLRLLQHVPSALSELTEMQHNELLIAWDRGYDSRGMWNPNLASNALETVRTRRASLFASNAAKKADKKKAEAAAKKAT